MRLPRIVFLLTFLAALPVLEAQITPSVKDFFQLLTEQYDAAKLPTQTDLAAVVAQIRGMSARAVSDAVPVIASSLSHPDDAVKKCGTGALLAIGMRPDGAELLKPAVGALGEMLNSTPNAVLSGAAIFILGTMHPRPLPEVAPPLLAFVGRTDRDTQVQARALGTLLINARGDDKPEVLAALEHFASRPLDPASRIVLLDSIGLVRKPNDKLNRIVVNSLKDADQGVRRRAIYHVSRMGPEVLASAASDLQRLAVAPDESQENRIAAQNALRGNREE